MNLGLLYELQTSRDFCVKPEAFCGFRNLILANIDGRAASHYKEEKACGGAIRMTVKDGVPTMAKDMVGNAARIAYWRDLDPEDSIINLVRLDGPMTRGGAECTYGTKDIRDQIMQSADVEQCRGHIIYCDTPGGSAACIQDLRMAINYAHSKGQKVNMLIDGECTSGGAFASALCDKVAFVNPEDEIGSIGMYSAFFSLADGAKNAIDSSVYHEYYATKSKDKNAWYRAAAEGDMKAVEEHVEQFLSELIDNMKADRPQILDEQMTGKMYKMKDVIGTLVDEQSDLTTLATEMFAEYDERQGAPLEPKLGAATTEPAQPADQEEKQDEDEPEQGAPQDNDADGDDNKPSEDGEPSDDEEPSDKEDDDDAAECKPDEEDETSQTENKTETMKTFTHIPGLLNEEAMETQDGTIFLNEEQAEALENAVAGIDAEHAAALAQVQTEKETAIAEAQSAHEAAVAELNKAHEDAVASLNEQINALNAQIGEAAGTHAAAIEAANATIAALKQQIEQLQQQNADLQAAVQDLDQSAGIDVDAGEQPANNGAAAPRQPRVVACSAVYDSKLSFKENAKRIREAEQNLRKMAH